MTSKWDNSLSYDYILTWFFFAHYSPSLLGESMGQLGFAAQRASNTELCSHDQKQTQRRLLRSDVRAACVPLLVVQMLYLRNTQVPGMHQLICPWTKWPPFRRNVQTLVRDENNWYIYIYNFIEICSLRSNWHYVSIGSDMAWCRPMLNQCGPSPSTCIYGTRGNLLTNCSSYWTWYIIAYNEGSQHKGTYIIMVLIS